MKRALLLAISAIMSVLLFSCSFGTDSGDSTGGTNSTDTSQNQSYTVTFIDGESTLSTVTAQSGETVKRPEAPKKEGNTFAGWYNGETLWNFATDKVTSDLTISAAWTPIKLSVAFNPDNGSALTSTTVNYGETLTAPEAPTKKDMLFDGWYLDGKKWDMSSPVTESMTLVAGYTPASVKVTLNYDNGQASETVSIGYGECFAQPSEPIKTDYTFLGWYVGGELYDFASAITSDITIVAKWKSDYVSVSFRTDGGTEIASQRILCGSTAQRPADPERATYTFAGWYYGNKEFDFSTEITDSITLSARWEEILVTVTFDTAGGEVIAPKQLHMGSTIGALTASRTEYRFICWMLDGSRFDNSIPVMNDITLVASWITLQESQWNGLREILDAETYAALKRLGDYYDGDAIIDWMASLWDGTRGMFYYSNSARDHYNYFPDVESTNQILGWLTANGAISSNAELNRLFPNDVKYAIITAVKDMQSASDGYFYHPQWPQGKENLQNDRYGRDLSWSTSIIQRFTVDTDGDGVEEVQYPNYCAPSGLKCRRHTGGGSCSFASSAASFVTGASGHITSSVGTSVSAAVSTVTSSFVTPVASSTPDYSSPEAFTKWLEEYNKNIKQDSGNAHQINALQSEIIAKGYCDELLDYLDRIQTEIYNEQLSARETPTGMWQKPVNYRAVWGLLKYAPFYNNATYGREIKYVKNMVATAIKVIELPASGDYYMNDIYNQWSSINSLITNVKKYKPDTLEDIYGMFREKAPSLIENSLSKITPFKNENGAFGYQSNGKSLSKIYGVPISLGVVESDVNATVLCSSMYRCIFTCMGLTAIPLCTPSDGQRFVDTISAATDRIRDFEDGIDSKVTLADRTGEAVMETVTDPTDKNNTALSFYSPKTSLSTSDGITVKALGGSGNCYVFDVDMYVKSSSDNGYLFQITMGNAYMITLHKSGSTVTIKETYSKANTTSTDLATAKTDEWFRLRVEYFNGTATGGTPKINIFLNDKYVTTTSGYFGCKEGKAPGTDYSSIYIYSMKAVKTDILIDDLYMSRENKAYQK